MSLVSAKSLIEIPRSFVTGYGASSITLDSANELASYIMSVPKAGDIHSVHFRVGTVTQDNSVKVSIQGVNTGGFPNGTIAASASVTVHEADDNTWQTATFGTDATVTVGQFIAVVFELDSWDSGDSLVITSISVLSYGDGPFVSNYLVNNNSAALTSGSLTVASGYYIRSYVSDDDFTNVGAASNATGVSFVATGTTPTHWGHGSALGVYAKSTSSPYFIPCLALEYSDSTFAPSFGPIAGLPANQSLSATTDPDQIGNYFQVPFPCRTVGVWLTADLDYDTTVSLYDASDTELANCVFLGQNRGQANTGISHSFFDSSPASTVTLAKDTWYRLIITGPATAINVVVLSVLSTTPAILDSLDLGQNCHYTQRHTHASMTWAETNYKRVAVGLIIDQLDNGVSSGGSSPRFGDMTGGLK
jgi:hypothetical protein